MSEDAKRARWLDARRKAWSGFTGLPNRLLDSSAYSAIASATAVRTLSWFWQEARYEHGRRKPGVESPIGRIDKIINNGKISFTYQVATWRGMNHKRFARGLKELYRLGFIDVEHLGRGRRGDYTRFALSTRWQKYGTSDWIEIPFPENFHQGFGFRDQSKKKNNGRQRPLLTDMNVRYEVSKLGDNGRKRPLKYAPAADSQRTPTSVSKNLAMPVEILEEVKKKVRTLNPRSKGTAPASHTTTPSLEAWRPPLSEIRENVVEILRQRPDPRADDSRLVRLLADQLLDAQRGKLDPPRVYRDFRERHDLDGWTSDLLFTVAAIDLQFRGATN